MVSRLLESRTVSVSIDRAPADVYRFAADPLNLPGWATAFARSVRRSGDAWRVETPDGPMGLRTAPDNALGVIDHYVSPTPGREIYNALRVVPNGEGSEVLFTLFRSPGVSEAAFAADATLVQQDLETLKRVLEQAPRATPGASE